MSIRTNRITRGIFRVPHRNFDFDDYVITEQSYPDDTFRYSLKSRNQEIGFMRVRWDGTDEARIVYFQVNPELRRQGIGSDFYEQIERTLREKGIKTISLRPADDEVYRFWIHRGFRAERSEDVPTYIGAGDLLKNISKP